MSPDGTTLLMLLRDAASAAAAPGQVNLVLNLFAQLKRIAVTQCPRRSFWAGAYEPAGDATAAPNTPIVNWQLPTSK